MLWYRVNHWEKSQTDQIRAEIQVPPDSPWFCGHFPGEPILPGIAQLGLVFDVIRRSGEQNVTVTQVRRVRFKRRVGPDERLTVVAIPRKEPAGSYSFRITIEKDLVCSGLLTLKHHPADSDTDATGRLERSGCDGPAIFDKGE